MKKGEFMVWSFSTTKCLHKFKLRWLLHNFTAPGNSSEPPCIMYSSWNCQLHAARNWQASPLCNHLAPSNVQANLQSPNDNVVASHQDVNSMQWRHLRLHDLTDSRTGRLLAGWLAAEKQLNYCMIRRHSTENYRIVIVIGGGATLDCDTVERGFGKC